MRKIPCFILTLLAMVGIVSAQEERQVKIKIVETSDVHGAFFPHDFILRQPAQGSLARISRFLFEVVDIDVDVLSFFVIGDFIIGIIFLYLY